MALDIDALLRQKLAMFERASSDALADVSRSLRQEIAKAGGGDPNVRSDLAQKLNALMHPERAEQVRAHLGEGLGGKRVLCIVDLAQISAPDLPGFLAGAEQFRRESGADVIDVAYIAGGPDRISIDDLGQGIERMVPTLGTTFFFDSPTLFEDFLSAVPDYEVFSGSHVAADGRILSPPREEMVLAARWMRHYAAPGIAVTLTFAAEAASGAAAQTWNRIAARMSDARIKLVVIPDDRDAYGRELISGRNVVYCHPAALSVPLGAAIRATAALNTFVGNRPVSRLGGNSNDLNFADHGETEIHDAIMARIAELDRSGSLVAPRGPGQE